MPGTAQFVYWQEDDMWLGYLQDYPDCWTQGMSLEELRENLLDIRISQPIPRHREIKESINVKGRCHEE